MIKLIFLCCAAALSSATNPFPSLVLRQKEFVDGTAGASSIYSTGYPASEAFQHVTDRFWHSGNDANGNGNHATPFPHLIWYKFTESFVPGRVSLRPRYGKGCGDKWCGATQWQFIGTNDTPCNENSAWTILCEDLSGKPFERQSQSKYCVVDRMITEKFSCLGISVLDSSFGGKAEVSVSGIRMWERVSP